MACRQQGDDRSHWQMQTHTADRHNGKARAPTWGPQRERSAASTRDARGHTYTSCRTHNYLRTSSMWCQHCSHIHLLRYMHAAFWLADTRHYLADRTCTPADAASAVTTAFLHEHASGPTRCYAWGSPCLAGRSCRERTGICCRIGKRHSYGTCTESCTCSSAHAGAHEVRNASRISVRDLHAGKGWAVSAKPSRTCPSWRLTAMSAFRSKAYLPGANVMCLPDATPK